MKVKDLIEKLKSFPPDSLVVTRGMDEHGFANIGELAVVKIESVKQESSICDYEESKGSNSINAVLVDH